MDEYEKYSAFKVSWMNSSVMVSRTQVLLIFLFSHYFKSVLLSHNLHIIKFINLKRTIKWVWQMCNHIISTAIKKLNISIIPKSSISPFVVNPIPPTLSLAISMGLYSMYSFVSSFLHIPSMLWRSILLVACISSLFLFIAEWYSIVQEIHCIPQLSVH